MDLSLDDIIQRDNRFTRGRGRGRANNALRGVRRGGGVTRRNTGGARVLPDKWQHDMFQGSSNASSTRLHISNLDYGVSNEDINELFREFGTIRRATVHYDRSGRSLGTAEVIYANSMSAAKARTHYNGVPLDGRSMVIQQVGAGTEVSNPQPSQFRSPRGRNQTQSVSGRVGFPRRDRGRGRGRAEPRKTSTKEELDAELAAYNSKRG